MRVKTAERELKDMAAKLTKAGAGAAQWKKRGEEAEAKLRVKGEKVVGQVALLEGQVGHWKVRSGKAQGYENVWKCKVQEAEEELRIRVQEAGEQQEEEEVRMVGIVAAAEAEASVKCDAIGR